MKISPNAGIGYARIEKTLSIVSLAIISVSIVAAITAITMTMQNNEAARNAFAITLFGLPLGFLILLALIVASGVRRRKRLQRYKA